MSDLHEKNEIIHNLIKERNFLLYEINRVQEEKTIIFQENLKLKEDLKRKSSLLNRFRDGYFSAKKQFKEFAYLFTFFQ